MTSFQKGFSKLKIGKVTRKAKKASLSSKIAISDKEKLILIIKCLLPKADLWIQELDRWPDTDLESCLSEIDDDELEDADREKKLIIEAAEITNKIVAENNIDNFYQREMSKLNTNALDQAERNYFFNKISANARFDHWLSKTAWTTEETAALCLGKDPSVVNIISLQSVPAVSAFRTNFENLADSLERAVRTNELGIGGMIKPHTLPTWLKKHSSNISDEVIRALSGKDSVIEKKSDNRALHTSYKMLLALTCRHYGFDPHANKGFPGEEIARDLRDLENFKVNPKTWANHLRAATDWAVKEGLIKIKAAPNE